MPAKTLAELKAKFEQGDTPTGQDFIDLIDSLLLVDGSNFPAVIPASSAANLTDLPIPDPLPRRDASNLFNTPAGEWTEITTAPNYATTTTFVLSGDHTLKFLPTRRVRLTLDGTYFYSEVDSASYASGPDATTVTIADAMSTANLTAAAVSAFAPWMQGGAVSPAMVGARADFAPHATAPASMMVEVEAGNILNGGAISTVPRTLSGAIIAPVSNSRITRLVRHEGTGALLLVDGEEGITPVAPSVPVGYVTLASVRCTAGMITITDAEITDERALFRAPETVAQELFNNSFPGAYASAYASAIDTTLAELALANWVESSGHTFGTTAIYVLIATDVLHIAGGAGGVVNARGMGNWFVSTSQFGTDQIRSGTHNNAGFYVLGGANGKLSTSSDSALTWTARTSGFGTDTIYAATYGNSLFVVGGSNGKVATSANGIAWALQTYPFIGTILAITYSPALVLFVAVGAAGAIATSPNGITWTARTSGTDQSLYSVAWGNGYFLAATDDAIGGTGFSQVVRSIDGITWSYVHGFYGKDVYALTFARGLFLAAVGLDVYSSPDGVTWYMTHSYTGNTAQLRAVAAPSNIFLAAGDSGSLRETLRIR